MLEETKKFPTNNNTSKSSTPPIVDVFSKEVINILDENCTIEDIPGDKIYDYLPYMYQDYDLFEKKYEEINSRLRYFNLDYINKSKRMFLILDSKRNIIGSLPLKEDKRDSSRIALLHINIDKKYTHKGLSKKLLYKALKRAIDQNVYKTFYVSSFSDEGEKYLPRELMRLQKKFPGIKIVMSIVNDPYEISIEEYCKRYHIIIEE